MIYLGWYDDNTKKKTIAKIDEAIERYEYKYGVSPNVCLVAEQELVEHPRIQVRPARHLRPNYYYVGIDDSTPIPPLSPVPALEAKAA
jgi:hypothetical protein